MVNKKKTTRNMIKSTITIMIRRGGHDKKHDNNNDKKHDKKHDNKNDKKHDKKQDNQKDKKHDKKRG